MDEGDRSRPVPGGHAEVLTAGLSERDFIWNRVSAGVIKLRGGQTGRG